ncbi:MRP-L47-domain-containing protein [Coemansia reversa NRRL 1564]|uniref:Large ribosomal subunit protein uL29m n=1 Tax=Coemansia reversa (strain ATCC 12441 / NRRL 1564) TaxID=763665 RepID=A0A2G5BF53_COERN|nr:MRP-L47-domain-containing protein [Coemansia reversa NRRL 1564]|eukprot:PIA17347.1 MRP-L47-domain-containing protein [Coemansia reversa NRRL 1564]
MFGAITRQLSTRRTAQGRFLARGFEEFFEKKQRVPTERDPTGRAWSASELRQKSWEDLQKLWYIVLKERNLLASQKVECRRLGIIPSFFSNKGRVLKCQKTMARIKTVLNERQIAWAAAQKNTKVHTHQQQSSQEQPSQE